MTSMIRTQAEGLLRGALTRVFQVPEEVLAAAVAQVAYPTDTPLAQVAFPCHGLARHLRMAPQAIAERLSDALRPAMGACLLRDPRALGGFLNFSLDVERVFALMEAQGPAGAPASDGKVDVEFSQPNTHKALHVGHLRNMVFGDAVCRLLQASGTRVVRSTFPGDLGTHVAKCLWYIQTFKADAIPKHADPDWLGRMYVEADACFRQLEGTPGELSARQAIAAVLRELETRSGPAFDLYAKTREWSLDQLRSVYRWLGIQFDRWYFESECDAPSRAFAQAQYESGFFRKSQGAVGLDLTDYDLGFAIFLKRDGTGLYLTKDLELLKRKFADPEVQASLVVVDSRQKRHFMQLFKTAELMGYPQAARSLHLSYEAVTDERGEAFSSRKAGGIHLDALRALMRDQVLSAYLAQYQGEWPDEEIQEAAEKIVLGALKYGFLKFDAGRIVKFVLEEWIQMEGNTGPYLQYTYARCRSLLGKVQPLPGGAGTVLRTTLEQDLVLLLERFPATVRLAAETHRPAALCAYLFDLAKAFNRVYKECPVRAEAEPDVRNTRLRLAAAVAATLQEGLGLLGIPCLERL